MNGKQIEQMCGYVVRSMRRQGFVFDEDDVRQDVAVTIWHEFKRTGLPIGRGTFKFYFTAAWRQATSEAARAHAPVSIPKKQPKVAATAWRMRRRACETIKTEAEPVDVTVSMDGQRLLHALAGAVHRSSSPEKRAALRFIRGGLTPEALADAAAVTNSRAKEPEKLLRRQIRKLYLSSPVAREAAQVILAS
jgi:hypothetical protein